MKKKGLTAKSVQYIEPTEKRFEVPAGNSLYLCVHPSGRKTWTLRYRWHGQTRKLTFEKPYPELSLAEARAEAASKLEDLEDGKDPAAVQTEEKEKAAPNSCKAVAEEWLKREVKGTATHDEVERILNREVLPDWKHRMIADIARPDVLRVLDALMDRDVPVLANRTLSILKRWFRWCVERGYIQVSPVAGLRPPAKETSRDRVLTHDELAEIWNAAGDLSFPFGSWFRMLILTGQRRSEVATMKREHVDLDAALWTLPAASNKARRIHDVLLSEPAKTLLESAPRFKGPYVFTTTSGERPISGFSKAKEALDKAILKRRKAAGETDSKMESVFEWHVHDLRRTLATWLADHDTPVHVVAAILNHSPGSVAGITAIYARSKYAREKAEALQKWADYVVSLEEKKEVNPELSMTG
jgi:integrase